MNRFRVIAAGTVSAVLIGLSGCSALSSGAAASSDGTADTGEQVIVISSKAAEMGTPDLATISFGIQTQETEAEAAQQANSETTDQVVNALRALSIDDSSIQTASYNLYPQYDYSNDSISGYQAQTTLCVKDQKVEDAGRIISAAVGAGANNVSDIQYSCSKYQELYDTALRSAITSSRDKAEAAATAAGKTLGGIVRIEEAPGDDYYRNYSSTNASMEAATADSTAVSIMPGEVEITAQVTVTYAMQ